MARGTRQPKLRKRVVAIFFIAILLPCLFLSYLGLNSIQQEKQWQRQLVLQNLKSSLSLTVDRIENLIEDELRSVTTALPVTSLPLSNPAVQSLQNFSDKRAIIEHIFLLDGEARLIYPRTFRDETTDRLEKSIQGKLAENEFLRNGELLEAQGLVDEALAGFQRGISTTVSKPERLAFLIRIARCEFKKNEFENARTTYHEIIKEDQNNFYGESIPYVAIAYMQLLTIAEKFQMRHGFASLALEFSATLVEHFDQFDRQQFSFYLDRLNAQLTTVEQQLQKSDRTRLETLRAQEKRIKDEQRVHEMLRANVVAVIRRELISRFAQAPGRADSEHASREESISRLSYYSFRSDGSLHQIAWQTRDDKKSPSRVVGYIIRNGTLDVLLQDALSEPQEGENIRTVLLDNESRIVYPEQPAGSATLLTAPFSRLGDLLPGHHLALVAMGENPLERIAARSLLIYYILLGSVIVFILLGVVLMFRDISREERLSEMKSEFIANVSHEIKTPIATIRTLAENLTEGWVTDPDKQREYYRLLAREGERLSHLVENILDFSRIEAKRKTYHREMVPVVEFVQKAIDRFNLQVEGQGVQLETTLAPNLPRVQADAAAMEQALMNLLDNAAKYSKIGKRIKLSAETEKDHVTIKVVDYGIGIEAKEIPKLFDKFYRIESSIGRTIPGSGIGLTLVKEIIEAHGGHIDVESEVGEGSTFIVIIPMNNQTSDGNNFAR